MDNKKKNKKYVVPEAEIVTYSDEDIITISTYVTNGWDEDGDQEGWWG